MTLETLASYNYKKARLIEEYRRFNRIHENDIAELAEELELEGYPVDRIADKILRDLSDEISKTVILRALPEKYLVRRSKINNEQHNDNEDSYVLLTVMDMQVLCEDVSSLVKELVGKLRNNVALAKQLENEEESREAIDTIIQRCKEIRSVIDDIKQSKDLDMRAYIRELQELCIHMLALTYSYRHIARVFGISAKWVSKIVRERSIDNLPSVYITVDKDIKKGERIDILPYAIALYKKREEEEED